MIYEQGGVVACRSFPGARRDACGGGDDAVGGLPETKVIAVASTRRNKQKQSKKIAAHARRKERKW